MNCFRSSHYRRVARPVFLVAIVSLPGFARVLSAAVIGTNPPALSLSAERVDALPASGRPAWEQYLQRSERQLRVDLNSFQKEMRDHGIQQTVVAPLGNTTRSLPLNQPAAWYAGTEGQRIAEIVVSFQTPAGGWSKNLDLTKHPRAPGETFGPDNASRHLGPADFDTPHNANWNYIGTFDNDSTTTELRYLAKVITAVGPLRGARYRAAFLRGLDYVLAAQYPNGGWPQVWPLQGGYHDAITFNDSAMVNILGLLRDVSAGTNEFAFVPRYTRALTADSLRRGIACVLASQIVVAGRRTVWCQQYDPITQKPTSARNYEMPSQSAGESSGIVSFLMQLPGPDHQIVAAVNAAAAWLEKVKVHDMAFRSTGAEGRRLMPAPGNGPIWSRYYEIGTDRPIFGDRDKTIHDDVNEISLERRNGYSWYNTTPQRALDQYAVWRKTHR